MTLSTDELDVASDKAHDAVQKWLRNFCTFSITREYMGGAYTRGCHAAGYATDDVPAELRAKIRWHVRDAADDILNEWWPT